MLKTLRLICIQLLLCGALWASEEVPTLDFNFKREFFRMLFMLSLIISMVVATTWMFKRMKRGKMRTFNNSSAIKVLERRAISPKSFLYLLEVDGTKILVGDSQAGLSGLAVLTEAESPPPSPPEKSPFGAIMREKLEKVACKERE